MTKKKAKSTSLPQEPEDAAGSLWSAQMMADAMKPPVSVQTIRNRLGALEAEPVAHLRRKGKPSHPVALYKAEVWRKVRDYYKGGGWVLVPV